MAPKETFSSATWNEASTRADLVDDAGHYTGHLELQEWWESRDGGTLAWVVSWLDPRAAEPTLLDALVEVPARGADTEDRRVALLAAAREARDEGPKPAPPRAPPLPAPPTYAERFRAAELLIHAWDSAQHAVFTTLHDEYSAMHNRYVAISDVLARTYTVDRTLQGMWDSVPADLRELASERADDRAVRAIAHNEAILARFGKTYEPEKDSALDAYYERQTSLGPYEHWSGHLSAGAIEHVLLGMRWVRGQVTYRGVTDPLELWPWRAGAQPRWKWKDAAAISLDRGDRRVRDLYDTHLAGRDVTGGLSHLLGVFWDGNWSLRKLLRRAEVRRSGRLRRAS